jgi:hypothetical protein
MKTGKNCGGTLFPYFVTFFKKALTKITSFIIIG